VELCREFSHHLAPAAKCSARWRTNHRVHVPSHLGVAVDRMPLKVVRFGSNAVVGSLVEFVRFVPKIDLIACLLTDADVQAGMENLMEEKGSDEQRLRASGVRRT